MKRDKTGIEIYREVETFTARLESIADLLGLVTNYFSLDSLTLDKNEQYTLIAEHDRLNNMLSLAMNSILDISSGIDAIELQEEKAEV